MAITIKRVSDPDQPEDGILIADRRLWLNAGGTKLVEHGDPAAAVLLAAPGQSITKADAARLGLELVDGAIQQRDRRKRAAKTEDKMGKPAEDKMAAPAEDKGIEPPSAPRSSESADAPPSRAAPPASS
jgi:hypothetical protein